MDYVPLSTVAERKRHHRSTSKWLHNDQWEFQPCLPLSCHDKRQAICGLHNEREYNPGPLIQYVSVKGEYGSCSLAILGECTGQRFSQQEEEAFMAREHEELCCPNRSIGDTERGQKELQGEDWDQIKTELFKEGLEWDETDNRLLKGCLWSSGGPRIWYLADTTPIPMCSDSASRTIALHHVPQLLHYMPTTAGNLQLTAQPHPLPVLL